MLGSWDLDTLAIEASAVPEGGSQSISTSLLPSAISRSATGVKAEVNNGGPRDHISRRILPLGSAVQQERRSGKRSLIGSLGFS